MTECDEPGTIGEVVKRDKRPVAPSAGEEPGLSADEVALLRATEEANRTQAMAGQVPDRPGPIRVLWPEGSPRYLVTVWLRETGDQFECFKLDVFSTRPGVSVSSGIMRELPVARLVREAIRRLLEVRLREAEKEVEDPSSVDVLSFSRTGELLDVGPDEEFLQRRQAFWQQRSDAYRKRLGEASGQGRGRRYPPGHLEEVARVVREARFAQEPIQTVVANFFGITRSAAGNQISRARSRGLLDHDDKEER